MGWRRRREGEWVGLFWSDDKEDKQTHALKRSAFCLLAALVLFFRLVFGWVGCLSLMCHTHMVSSQHLALLIAERDSIRHEPEESVPMPHPPPPTPPRNPLTSPHENRACPLHAGANGRGIPAPPLFALPLCTSPHTGRTRRRTPPPPHATCPSLSTHPPAPTQHSNASTSLPSLPSSPSRQRHVFLLPVLSALCPPPPPR